MADEQYGKCIENKPQNARKTTGNIKIL